VRFWYDTEFIENGTTIDLISIGIVASDGREYYAVASDAPWRRIRKDDWLMANVVRHLPHGSGDQRNRMPRSWLVDFTDPRVKPRVRIAEDVADFILGADRDKTGELPYVELWADYAAYDHVVLCQLWGRMLDLPEGMPMFTRDIQQEADRLGLIKQLPQQDEGLHNALADARHCRERWEFLTKT
jgi:3' exoribonuclease, RNase T-like